MEPSEIIVDLDKPGGPAEPEGPSSAQRVWALVVGVQAVAALAVGLVVSVVGFFGNATISLMASMLPWSDPLRLAVPLFVAGAFLAVAVAAWLAGPAPDPPAARSTFVADFGGMSRGSATERDQLASDSVG